MTVYISSEAKFIIYADYTTIFLSPALDVNIFHMAKVVLEQFSTWSAKNQLNINTKKTKSVGFHSVGRQVFVKGNLVYRGSEIELVNSNKVLGVHFSKSLQWEEHENAVLQTLGSITGIVNRKCYLIPKSLKLFIYNALFASYLHYCYFLGDYHRIEPLTAITNAKKILENN